MIAFTRHKGLVPLRGVLDVPQCLARVAAALNSSGARNIHCGVDSIQFEGAGPGSLWTSLAPMTDGAARVELVGREHVLFYDVSLRGVFRIVIRLCAFVCVFGVLVAACAGLFMVAVMLLMSAGMSVVMVVASMLHAKYRVDKFFCNAVHGQV